MRSLLREPWKLPVTAIQLETTVIQSFVRRFLVMRRKSRGIPQSCWREVTVPKPSSPPRRDGPAPLPLLSRFLETNPLDPTSTFPLYCATRIAASYRGHLTRRRYLYLLFDPYTLAALMIQNTYRSTQRDRYIISASSLRPSPESAAASTIQNAYRRMTSIRVYNFYKDLISFRASGDPKLLLKTINPSEAALFDASSKVHVRFRLGGEIFPPTLYYKVFTSAPLCDVGAFAPRDYTREEAKMMGPEELHNKSVLKQESFPVRFDASVVVGRSEFEASGVLGDAGTEGWYRRVENNGWRAVTVKATDELGRGDSSEIGRHVESKTAFHFSKLVRKQDLAATRKKKKREWLRRMYEVGLAKEIEEGKVDVVDRQATIQRELLAGEGGDGEMFRRHMKAAGEEGYIEVGEDGEVDVEVEKLLEWTQDLDYDDYIGNWGVLGTSGTTYSVSDPRRYGMKDGRASGTGGMMSTMPTGGPGSSMGRPQDSIDTSDSADVFFDYGLGL